ncbi:MAG: twin-arginine translocation signal domain-containing protein [Bacteroidales bacterium]|nr:twin-arginine translocation signal domain-containing protein [Bacteroidales bacterium]
MSENKFSRRGFLKTLGMTMGAMALVLTCNKVQAATNILERKEGKSIYGSIPLRTLDSGNAAFNVSTLGFGVMGMTSSQVALGWLLQKEPFIVPIPGTTKLSHLEENLRTLDFEVSTEEWKELELAVAQVPVVGDRYNADQQKQVGF